MGSGLLRGNLLEGSRQPFQAGVRRRTVGRALENGFGLGHVPRLLRPGCPEKGAKTQCETELPRKTAIGPNKWTSAASPAESLPTPRRV